MKRRSLVALVAAGVLVFLGLLVASGVLFLTRTYRGREVVRSVAQPFIARALKGGGTIYIGHLGGNFLTQLTIDTVAIRDGRGELFLSSGPITLEYNPRDLIDYRILIRRATVEHPYVHIIQYADYSWNFKKLFATSSTPKTPEVSTRGWGNYIVADSTHLHDGTFLYTQPWHPDDSLKGARRDSVIRVTLANPARAVTQTFDGFGRLYAWKDINGLIAHARLADPDSDDKYGKEFKIATLSADGFEPTFKYRNVVADARLLGDSVWFESPHFELPASNGRGAGKVWWGSDLPTRYDIIIHGTSVALDDVNWAYPPLPRTGGGSLDLAIRNDVDPKKLQIVDFRLMNMDVRTTGSHVTGTMWFGIGAPVLLVRNVDLRADPLDFDFIRHINLPKPLPVDWRGQLYGTVKGRGGPLTHFMVDESNVTFRDTHVPGAVSKASGQGELDILNPSLTAFHNFAVNASTVDLRSIEYLYPSFPRLGGFLSGTATLDSSYLDVRFSNANLFHQDGPSEPSHVTGSGRITYGEPFMSYEVSLDARPLSLTTLSRSYPSPLRGTMSGPIKVAGQSPDLALTTTLTGDAGTFSFDGRIDLDTVGGIGARGHGQFSGLNPSTLLAKTEWPHGVLSGHYDVDVNGSTASSLRGTAGVAIERTAFGGVTVYPSRARATFGNGGMHIDTLLVETAAGTLHASGGIGLPKGSFDSLTFTYDLDSLGGLRHTLSSAGWAAAADSLSGEIKVTGFAQGRLDSLRLAGTLSASQLYMANDKSHSVNVDFDFANATDSASGRLTLRADTTTVGGIVLDTLGGTLVVTDPSHAQFTLGAQSHNGPLVVAGGTGSWLKTAWEVGLSSLDLVVGKDEWKLAGQTRLQRDSLGTRLDSLVLRNRDSAVVAASGNVPNSGNVVGRVRATNLPLDDIGVLEQFADSISGLGRVDATLSGTRDHPILVGAVSLAGLRRFGVTLDSVTLSGQLRDRDAKLSLAAVRSGLTALTADATIPVDFRLFSLKTRNDAMSGTISVPSTDLSIIQLASQSFSQVTGTLRGDISIAGTPNAPVLRTDPEDARCISAVVGCSQGVQIVNGGARLQQLGIELTDIQCTVSGAGDLGGGDSVSISKCLATSLGARGADRGKIAVTGWVKNLARFFLAKPDPIRPAPPPSFRLTVDTLRNFHAFNKRNVADIYLTTQFPSDAIQIVGELDASRLTGAVQVDHSAIFLADRDLARKQIDQTPLNFTSETVVGGRAPLAKLLSGLTTNFTVTLGNDVRLKSKEADVRLGGTLNVVNSTARANRLLASTSELIPRVGVEGTLRTIGGTYVLDLGLARRQFDVLADGSVTFTGDPYNPTLDISAQYNVKQYRDRDLGVIVNLRGPLNPYPEITFSSNADYTISQSDLVSYLVTGAPGFELNNQTREVLAQFIGPTVSAAAASSLRSLVGPWVDALRFELGTGQQPGQTSTTSNLQQYLYGATLGVEKQFAEKMYLSLNTGLCQFENNVQSSSLLSGFGATVEYRFTPKFSTQLAFDPATATRTCSPGQSIIGIVPTPSQFILSLHHTFRF